MFIVIDERRQRMITNYHGLVEVVVDKLLAHPNYQHFRFMRDDLLGEGYLGLILAIDTYKKGKGTTIVTYISMKVRGRSIDCIRKHKRLTTPLIDIGNTTIENLTAKEYDYEEELVSEEAQYELIDQYEPKNEINKEIYHTQLMGSATNQEVADTFGVSINSIKKRKARMKSDLRDKLQGELI